MKTLLTTQWLNKAIPGSHNDADICVISNYTPLAYVEKYGSAGLITRIIEIYQLRAMKPLFHKFEENTGYTVGDTSNEQELDLLTHNAVMLHDEIHARLNGLKANLSKCDDELAKIKNGVAGSSADAIRSIARAANEDKSRLTHSVAKAESWCDFIASILQLLNSELKEWEKSGYKRKDKLPKITSNLVGEHYLRSMSKEASLLLDKLKKLEGAINNINACFSIPNDRFESKRLTAQLNIEACKFYYSREGAMIRNIMTRTEYVRSVAEPMENAIQRDREMQAEINYTQ